MILSVHATFGAAIASLVPSHPVTGFTLGFVSHFVLDAIPHRDYNLISVEFDVDRKMKLTDRLFQKFRLIRDMTVVSLDALAGLVLAFMFFFDYTHPWVFLAGALGALLPDFCTFLCLLIKHKALSTFYTFHVDIIHSKTILGLNQYFGVALQYCVLAFLISLILLVKHFLL